MYYFIKEFHLEKYNFKLAIVQWIKYRKNYYCKSLRKIKCENLKFAPPFWRTYIRHWFISRKFSKPCIKQYLNKISPKIWNISLVQCKTDLLQYRECIATAYTWCWIFIIKIDFRQKCLIIFTRKTALKFSFGIKFFFGICHKTGYIDWFLHAIHKKQSKLYRICGILKELTVWGVLYFLVH